MALVRYIRNVTWARKRILHNYSPRILTKRTAVTNTEPTKPAAVSIGDAVRAEFPVGEEVCGFVVRTVEEIKELHLTAVRLEHLATGADYLHVARDDANNVFSVGFRTTPMDSTGVPHILEHTVLCGSREYPCRDPFFKMLNRSLSTFMNAMTGSDFTIYPFSTQHPADFRNLMSVYLDAVFRPNLLELDFLQEGWRLEHQDVNDQSSPLVFKGVVFNEMKGVFADSQRLFMQKLQNGLLPSHTYGVVSGGDPLAIPQLTWEQLRHFHAYHYHPSNAHFFTYGDQPLAQHLKFINDNYLSSFDRIDPKTEVPEEPSWSQGRSDHVECGVDPMAAAGGGEGGQTSVAVAYKLVNITDSFENFVLHILCELLTSGPNAPFYKSLLEPQLGSGFSPSAGYDGHTRNTSFTIGLQGVRPQDVDQVLSIIDNTFQQVAQEGFPQSRVDAVLHTLELGLKHQTSSFGLALAMTITPLWNLDGDPVEALKINSKINKFRKCLDENPKYLQEKVRQFFLQNNHKYSLTMTPKPGYEEQLQVAEEDLLAQKVSALSEHDKIQIWEQGQTLAHKQEEEEDLSSLPTLRVSDIKRTVSPTPVLDLQLAGGVNVQLCQPPTNGITYFSALLDTQHVPPHLRPLVPLLCGVLTHMGAGHMDFRELDQQADLVTGGLHVDTHTAPHPYHVGRFDQGILLTSHCLNHNLDHMLDLWSRVFTEVRLDDLDRFTTLVNMIATDLSNSLVYSGHRYAMTSAAASISHMSALQEEWCGLSWLRSMKSLSQKKDLSDTLEQLRQLAALLLNREGMRVAVNTTPDYHTQALNRLESFLSGLHATTTSSSSSATHNNFSSPPVKEEFTLHTSKTHYVFPFPVNFAGMALPGVPYLHPDVGTLRVLPRLMFRFLHREIREKGGAYGGGAMATPGGPFCFYSYRDPHSTQTLATFSDAVEWVLAGNFNERDVEEAKLGTFQNIDAPVSPGAQGTRRFLAGITDQYFSEHRQLVLDTTPQDLVTVARTYLSLAPIQGTSLIGPHNEDIAKDGFWNTVHD
ncbi:hypothetical protein Pcinc_038757 [Petrolisthes cinctipes]|uniref:Presequence protease, mitochondrial n=1 Tax=Petrolisthes cinctipes TaxID=88211 RepID=A0AAE1BPV5_PETCI|nr:hypothetical protein Pcinc_038757 [Petrolisthes cinctipes]